MKIHMNLYKLKQKYNNNNYYYFVFCITIYSLYISILFLKSN